MSKLDTGLQRPLASGIKWGEGLSHSPPGPNQALKKKKPPQLRVHKYLNMRCCLTQVKLRENWGTEVPQIRVTKPVLRTESGFTEELR